MSPIPDPPLDLIEYVCGVADVDFARRVGRYHRDFFVNNCGLRPEHRVLEVGCGVGRIAAPLTEVIAPPGCYHGFDISERAVAWCRANISEPFPHFRFRHADVFNEFYNPRGSTRGRRYRFPYPTGSFDFVYLTSVFTHLLPHDLQNYLREVSRVLAPGGRCVMTFFLHDGETAALIRQGKSTFQLPCRYGSQALTAGVPPTYGECRTETIVEPERVVAYEAAGTLDRIAACGLRVDEVRPGTWSGRTGFGFQDVVVTTKVRPVSARVRWHQAMRFEGLREAIWRLRTTRFRRDLRRA